MTGYNYIDLFHGIGGFALGAYWAGMKFENHFCSDIEPYAQKLYKLRFPESIQLGDITKINTEDLKQHGNKWIITGGFPCQDISIAGKGAGITGARSGLWFEYWRLIRGLRPKFAIMENVGALTFRGLDAVLGSLAEIGYNAEWQDIRASDMGAPHKRERIWIIAYPDTASDRRQWFGENAKIKEGLQQRSEHSGELEGGFEGLCKDVADTGQQPEGMPGNRFDSKQQQCEEEKFWSGQRDRFTDSGENVSNNHSQRFKEQYNGITERPGDFNGCDAGRKAEHPGWSTEPAVGGCFDGVSTGLDSVRCLTYFSHLSIKAYVKSIYGEIDGKTKRKRAGEILRTLRDGIEKEELQWQTGGFDGVQKKKVLLSYLCELQEASEELDNISFEGKETFEREMRELRMEFFLTSASYRPRLQEQREREHPDSLQTLSRLLAHDCKKDWERNSRENARIKYGWEQNIPRLITKLPGRVDRLKGLGNAIVPQISELLFNQIKELIL
jgi:DNA-cytosine methyltransferase